MRRPAPISPERGTLLLGGAPDRASVLFTRVLWVPGLRQKAEAGQALVQAFRGQDPGGTLRSETWADFPPEHLLSLLARQQPDGAGRRALATLLARSGDRLAALDLAALELDGGQDAAAGRRLAHDPAAFEARALGREIRDVMARRAEGTATVVRDRLGRRLGFLTPEHRRSSTRGSKPTWCRRRSDRPWPRQTPRRACV